MQHKGCASSASLGKKSVGRMSQLTIGSESVSLEDLINALSREAE